VGEQPGAPIVVGQGPVPLQIITGNHRMPDGTAVVIMQVHCPVGIFTYFLPLDFANDVGQQLIGASKTGATGLHLPPGVKLN
jgi:hypothetical protein